MPEGLYTSSSEDSFETKTEITYKNYRRGEILIDEGSLPTKLSFEEFHEEAVRRADFREKVEGESRIVNVEIPTDRPIAIAFFSDPHLGSAGIDYKLLKETADLIKEHPLAYTITGGDLTDSLFFDYGEEIMNMQEQWVYMNKLLKYLGSEKIIAGILGNHDAWSRKSGVHNHIRFTDDTERPLMRGVSYMNLKVGEQSYKIMMSHLFKGSSMYNENHPQSRANREIPGADIIMSAHNHKGGEQNKYQTYYNGETKKIVFIAGKTFKKLDAYGKDGSYTPVSGDKLGCNWLILNHDTRMIRVASSNEEMIETMSAYI